MNDSKGIQATTTHSWTSLAFTPILVILAAISVWYAFLEMYTVVSDYDDEGYMIASLSHYLRDGGLYTTTFGQYGPFYFFIQQALHGILPLPVNHNGVRAITLLWWLFNSALSSWFVLRITNNKALAALAFTAETLIGYAISGEPGHPQQVVLPLLQGAVWTSWLTAKGRRNTGLFLLGAIACALTLTKINVGMFLVFAIMVSLAGMFKATAMRNLLMAAMTSLAVILPLYLMRVHWSLWARSYALLSAACLATICVVVWRTLPSDFFEKQVVKPLLAGAFGCFGLICLLAFAQGITFHAMLDGVLLRPMRTLGVFSGPLRFTASQVITASLALVLVLLLSWRPALVQRFRFAICALKVLVGMSLLILLANKWMTSMMLLEPMLGLLLIRSDGKSWQLNEWWPRSLLCTITAFQMLQAYPVGGNQVAVALASGVAWGALMISDGIDGLPLRAINKVSWKPAAALLVALLIVYSGGRARLRSARKAMRQPSIGLRGAEWVHLSSDRSFKFQTVVRAIEDNCTMLFSAPGMYSFNSWSNVPTPNGMNLTAWMTFFTIEEQQEIVRQLRTASKPCVLIHKQLMQGWMPDGPAILSQSPVMKYAENTLVLHWQHAGYELRTGK